MRKDEHMGDKIKKSITVNQNEATQTQVYTIYHEMKVQ